MIFSMRMRLAKRATAMKKQTTRMGMNMSTQAMGSRLPKQRAWKMPVPKRPTRTHQVMVRMSPTAAWYIVPATEIKRMAVDG
jgi:hypothetical protein